MVYSVNIRNASKLADLKEGYYMARFLKSITLIATVIGAVAIIERRRRPHLFDETDTAGA